MLGELPWWVTVVILVREIGITVLRFAVLRHGVIPASRGGKLKTLVQAVAIGLFILPLSGPWLTGAWVVMVAAIVLTVLTGRRLRRVGDPRFPRTTRRSVTLRRRIRRQSAADREPSRQSAGVALVRPK